VGPDYLPASVSVAVADLEATLDIQLFVRQPAHGMKLTPDDEIVLAEARSLLTHADEFQSRTGSLSGLNGGSPQSSKMQD
jgi:DNA-binding transcriptional LysR family regulator